MGKKLLSRVPNQQTQVIRTRWTLLVGAAYLVLFGSGTELPFWQQVTFVAFLLGNLGLCAAAVRKGTWDRLRWFITIADIAFVTVAVAFAGGVNDDFFLFFFLVLMVSGLSNHLGLTMLATLGVCAIYAGIMYAGSGEVLWRKTEMLIRLPFLFGVGMFFGSMSAQARREQGQLRRLFVANRKMAHRYHQVASERDRIRALLEISQLALSPMSPQEVLRDITLRIQKTVRVDRCSLVVFNEGDRHAYLAAASDQQQDVVLLLPLRNYPELEETLATGTITELHSDDPGDLWDKVRHHLPYKKQFASWLVVPIMQQDVVAGAFFLRDSQPDFDFHDDEKVFCEAASLMAASYLQGRDLVEEMCRRSRLDGLTGLLNFPTFRQELENTLQAHRDGSFKRPISLLMVDIDNLKIINDGYGHMVGNRVIQEVGRLLAHAVPSAIATCRYGGDEFFALVPMTKEKVAERAERLLIALEELQASDLNCRIAVSIGVSSLPDDGEVADTLLEAADRAMYLAKGAGGHRIHIANSGDDSSERVYEAVIAVNARRLIPGEARAFRKVLDQLLRLEEQELDSTVIKQSLTSLMEAVQSKDKYTEEHSQEVSDLTRDLALAAGLTKREVLAVEMGALVHDIGKIGIADEILNKPGPLSTRERLRIERHPEIGAQILRPMPALSDVVPLVLHHHERWDGGGYPHGLAGKQIPEGAQIISLCDVWNALTSDRSYRPAFPQEKVRAMIMEGRGTEWDPDLVDLFFELLERKPELSERLAAKHQRAASDAA